MIPLVYRGTQRAVIEGVRKGQSFAYSLGVAVIWSAHPGDAWTGRPPQFVETSTVHAARVVTRGPLQFAESNYCSLADVLQRLNYPTGIADDEVRKIYNYLHNRITGKAVGGEFSYVVLDPEGEERDEDEVPFSLRNPQSLVTLARNDWDCDPSLDTAAQLVADAYIFADAPAVQRAAQQLGYDMLIYPDVFQGGEDAARELLGCDVYRLDGVTEAIDLKGNYVPQHLTVRLLDPTAIVELSTTPTVQLLDQRFC